MLKRPQNKKIVSNINIQDRLKLKNVVGNLSIMANAVSNAEKYRYVAPIAEVLSYRELKDLGSKISSHCYYNTKKFVQENTVVALKEISTKACF